MQNNPFSPIDSFESLKTRIESFFKTPTRRNGARSQQSLDLFADHTHPSHVAPANTNVSDFIDFLADTIPTGNLYLFGGLLRDIALLGGKAFNSDIDLVVEGDWRGCVKFLEKSGAHRNKFGGYRFHVGRWPVDIWNAEETWAIRRGLVPYDGIFALTGTTVLNWDAILMNWKSRNFICRDDYLESLINRRLDIVLEENPNPKGMAVRVFRHLCLKDAKQITAKAVTYLAACTARYSFDDIKESEMRSYGSSVIDPVLYRWFELIWTPHPQDVRKRMEDAGEKLKEEGISLLPRQREWNFEHKKPR